MRVRESPWGRRRRLCDEFFFRCSWAIRGIGYGLQPYDMKTFLKERISMPTTYIYIYFNDFNYLQNKPKVYQAFSHLIINIIHVLRLRATVC